MSHPALRRYRPPETQILLLIAALAEPVAAAVAWQRWTELRDLDTTAWAEVRLLSALAPRLAALDPASPYLPRIKGISRYVWTHTQITLAAGRPLLAALHQAGIPLLVLKGGARMAQDPVAAAGRLLRDIDVLVPRGQWPRALEIADRLGWLPAPDASHQGRLEPETVRRIFPMHHAIGFRHGKGEVDLHHSALYMSRHPGADDGLWQRAQAATLQSVPVLVPSPADELLHGLCHGALYSPEPVADWALDTAALIRAGTVDWRVFEAEAVARSVEPYVVAGLMLLVERIGLPVPAAVLKRLTARARDPFIKDFEAHAVGFDPDHPALIDAVRDAAGKRAVAMLERQAKPPAGPRRRHVTESAPFLAMPEGLAVANPVPTDLSPWGNLRIELEVVLGAVLPGGRLALELRAPGLALKRWYSPAKGKGAAKIGSNLFAVELPACLLLGRGIDWVIVRELPLAPALAPECTIETMQLRWVATRPG
jgi:Uncharacterised nucleotidyltransferase